jgi:hypothetical protein
MATLGVLEAPRPERVAISVEAAELLASLELEHGPLVFHQSGGCCDGSSPMCFPAREFKVGQRDVFLGVVAGCEFYMGAAQFEYWRHTHLTIDVVAGRGGGFSVEAPRGLRFLIRSRLFSDEESARLSSEGEPPRGPQAHGCSSYR